mmetsp:Transcript_44117/g.99449  ORF Transcript_44117/g.99449 Transcript_44117/m.99449 type:complete len:292 (+) Transcript_44117:54-929(+)
MPDVAGGYAGRFHQEVVKLAEEASLGQGIDGSVTFSTAAAAAPPPPPPEPTAGVCRGCGGQLTSQLADGYVCSLCSTEQDVGVDVNCCEPCGFYTCARCPTSVCPAGHALVAWRTEAYCCRGCEIEIAPGDPIVSCHECLYNLCGRCSQLRRSRSPGARSRSVTPPPDFGIELCRHVLEDVQVKGDPCGVCSVPSEAGAITYVCEDCRFRVCLPCNTRVGGECGRGHLLTPKRAEARSCRRCASSLPQGELARSCTVCMYYVCQRCPAAGSNALIPPMSPTSQQSTTRGRA